MAEQESGDKEFERFINDRTNNSSVNNLPMIIKGLKDKMDFIKNMYETSLTCYRSLEYEDDVIEKVLLAYIVKLTEHSERCLDQCDMVLLDYENADLGTMEEEEEDSDEEDPLKELGL